MECSFCTEFADTTHSRVIFREDDWVLLPTLGCFVAGYCLLMTIEHVEAAADLPALKLEQMSSLAERYRTIIESEFGSAIVAEHGARDCRLGAACCTHLHLHIIPVPDVDAVTAAYQQAGGPGSRLDALENLPAAVSGPYLYLSPRRGIHLVWAASQGFARQFVRHVTARLHRCEELYDWREHAFTDIQADTLRRLQIRVGSDQRTASYPQ